MEKSEKSRIKARIASFGYAFKGIWVMIKTQPHARFHLMATLGVTLAGFAFQLPPIEWGLVLLAMAVVWVAEGMNTAIEFIVDLVSPDYHELAGRAKDVAAGAVLIGAIFAALIAAIIFLPRLYSLVFL